MPAYPAHAFLVHHFCGPSEGWSDCGDGPLADLAAIVETIIEYHDKRHNNGAPSTGNWRVMEIDGHTVLDRTSDALAMCAERKIKANPDPANLDPEWRELCGAYQDWMDAEWHYRSGVAA